MKTFCIFAAATITFLSIPFATQAAGPIVGAVIPVSSERISILPGDKAAVNLGTKDGLVKGDLGLITTDRGLGSEGVIGQCAITRTGYDSSICEVIKAKKEIGGGYNVLFEPVRFNDENYYSLVMNTLASVLEPYQPYDRLRVCIYGFFDNRNAITGLSEQIANEFRAIFSQKNRINLVSKEFLKNLVIYPDASQDLVLFAKNQMRRNDIDVLIIGRYTLSDDRVEVAAWKLDRRGQDGKVVFSFPTLSKYVELASRAIVTAQEPTKAEMIPCNIVLRSTPRLLQKEEKNELIKSESMGNPITEQALRRIDFNNVSPVEVKATIDGETVSPVTEDGYLMTLSIGNHAMKTSFRRGYFFNETLLYTSAQEVAKEAVLSLSQDKGVVVEIGINASTRKDPIYLSVYQPIERQRRVLKPIYGVEYEKTIDAFKD
jgi:hypothetical protein